MDLENAVQIFNALYDDVNGYQISYQARHQLPYYDKAHTYGEVTPEAFHRILREIPIEPGQVFYDLGSGTGKAVVLSHLLFPFQRSVGVELLSELYRTSESVSERLKSEYANYLSLQPENKEITFINQDFLSVDLTDVDVVFTHSTCFHPSLMEQLEKKLHALKKGTYAITVSKTLETPEFRPIKVREANMGWGTATVYIYQRL
ncbi:SAM-dependent methyltransferase [Candidatus Roizmanbacteria bacterium]|nr:SAM-dependent methyltransferase [Candidatus Roizmanbacteria bacterium]